MSKNRSKYAATRSKFAAIWASFQVIPGPKLSLSVTNLRKIELTQHLIDSHLVSLRVNKKPPRSPRGLIWRRRELHPRPETHPSGRLRVCPVIWFSSGSPQLAGCLSAYPVVFSHQSGNRRLVSGQPELASPNMTLGPKSCCGASSLLRQRGEVKECLFWHL